MIPSPSTSRLALFLIVLTGFVSAAHAQLVARWTFDEGIGTTTLEQVSNTLSPILDVNGPTSSLWTAGIAPGSTSALAFNGIDGPKSVAGGNLDLGLGASFTMTAWISVDAYTGSDAVLAGNGIFNSVTGWLFGVRNFNGESSLFFDLGSTRQYALGFAPEAGTPTFVAVVKDADADLLTFYMSTGGALQTFSAAATSNAAPRSDAVNIGIFNTDQPRQFNGVVDDFRIYDGALSSSEIAAVVPEPGTYALLGMALLVSLALRRVRASRV